MEIALYRPEIPPNTGNIGRLCYCTGTRLHIIGKASFLLDEASVRRAGLDYWKKLKLEQHKSWEDFKIFLEKDGLPDAKSRILLFTRFAKHLYSEHSFKSSDVLVFGQESKGLPQEIKDDIEKENEEHLLGIPLKASCRSLNLSNAAAIVLFEALRQQSFPHSG